MDKQSDNPFEDSITIEISKKDSHDFKRLDQYLVKKICGHSRTFIKKLFSENLITAPGAKDKLELKKMPPAGTVIEIEIPKPLPLAATPENIPLEIIHEDQHLVIINKPAGLVTHPGPGNWTGTLVNAVLHHCPDLGRIGDSVRPGIVHRLDKGTSGIMVVAKNMKCHEGLVSLFSKHDIERRYETLVLTKEIPPAGTIESTIGRHRINRLKMAPNIRGGKKSITHYRILEKYRDLTHLELKLETGRTHQIRVHLASLLKTPVLMDPLYANPNNQLKKLGEEYLKLLKDWPHPLLHARILGFIHPITGRKLYFEIDPPDIFRKVLELAKKNGVE